MIYREKIYQLSAAFLLAGTLVVGQPMEAQTVEHIRTTDHVTSAGVTDATINDVWFTYLCQQGNPLCGGAMVDLAMQKYTASLPRTVKVVDVESRDAQSIGWSWVNAVPHDQDGFCFIGTFDDETVDMRNSVHRVQASMGGGWYPTEPANSTCAYRVLGVPEEGLLQWSGTNGVFGIHDSGSLVRRYWSGAQWNNDSISTWGGAPIIGSLVQGGGVGAHGEVYGVNEYGEVFTTWNNGGEIEYAIIPGTSGVRIDSLTFTGPGVLYATKKIGLIKIYWSNGWQVDHIPHWGARLVADSLIAGSSGHVFGVNTAGQAFGTWNNGGVTTFALIPGAVDLVSDSLVKSPSHGIFAVKNDGSLMRFYWSSGWQTEVISHWGGPLVADSFVPNTNNGHIIGVNEAGQLAGTYTNSGNVTFATIPGTSGIVPNSVAVTPNGIFSVRDDGALLRSYWSSGWNTEVIPHTGADIVPESLIPSEIDQIYGLNEDGEVFATWIDGGSFAYALLP